MRKVVDPQHTNKSWEFVRYDKKAFDSAVFLQCVGGFAELLPRDTDVDAKNMCLSRF